MKKSERKKWNEDNILLASQYLKDAYRTFNDPYCETYYINAIELLTRSLLFTLYTELSDEKVQAVKKMIGGRENIEITLTSMLKSHSAYNNNCLNYNKLQNLRNDIIHKGVAHNKLECVYTHNFFVETFKELKALIEKVATQSSIKMNLSRLELGFMPHVVNIGEKQSSTLDMIANIYGEEFVKTRVKIKHFDYKTDGDIDAIYCVIKHYESLPDDVKNMIRDNPHHIVMTADPSAVKKTFPYYFKDFNSYHKKKISSCDKGYPAKTIPDIRGNTTENVDWITEGNQKQPTYKYSRSFAMKLLGNEYDDFISYKNNP